MSTVTLAVIPNSISILRRVLSTLQNNQLSKSVPFIHFRETLLRELLDSVLLQHLNEMRSALGKLFTVTGCVSLLEQPLFMP